jgi:hypothetical protein
MAILRKYHTFEINWDTELRDSDNCYRMLNWMVSQAHLISNMFIRERENEMAKLKTSTRNKLPKSDFALPGSRKYPMPDKKHAVNAKARATQMVKKGKLSESSKNKIDAKANKVLGKKKR